MHEMNDFAQQEVPEFEPRPRTVSFPDHYLLPYIDWCKRSKPVTCSCSIMFFGLAIFCFFATNYMINYPATVSRKIAFVFAGVFCIVCGVVCLKLRVRISDGISDVAIDNVGFETARRNTGASITSSFSGRFEEQETSFCNGASKEEPSPTETPENSSLRYSTDDETFVADSSTYKYTGPRRSIPDGRSLQSPLMSLRRPLEISKPSLMQNVVGCKRFQNGGIASSCANCIPNYSTFRKEINAFYTEHLFEPTFENGCDTH